MDIQEGTKFFFYNTVKNSLVVFVFKAHGLLTLGGMENFLMSDDANS